MIQELIIKINKLANQKESVKFINLLKYQAIKNLMNFTQPQFHKSPRSKNLNNQSILSLNQPIFQIFNTKQIHKTSDNIKKVMRFGKVKKNYYHAFKSQKERYDSKKIDKNQKQQSPDNDFHIYARKINNLSKKLPQEVSFDAFVRQQKQKNNSYLNEMRSKLIKQAEKTLYTSTNKSLDYKRKLSPIKRGTITLQKKVPKKQLKITFLNIQKAPLFNYLKKDILNQEQQQTPCKKLLQIWNADLVDTNFSKSPYLNKSLKRQELQKLAQTTKQFHQKRRISISQDLGLSPTLLNFKKFVPPFQRYYYRDFLWKVAFSNDIYFQCPKQYQKKFKVFIGKGNNSLLIKSLMKRRGEWWTFTQKYEEANFIWTQIKINDIFKKQQSFSIIQAEQKSLPPAYSCKKKLTYQLNRKILNQYKVQKIEQYLAKNRKIEQKLDGTMVKRNKAIKNNNLLKLDLNNIKIHNHLTNNYIIGNKKALYYTMTTYYQKIGQNPFQYLPQTYHIQNGLEDQQYMKFLASFYPKQKQASKQERQNSPERHRTKNIWIVKPGQFTNRGNGINVCLTLQQIKRIIKSKQKHENGNLKTYIIQSYIDKPFLYQKRKFDIRHYMMITSINGQIKGYWYELGYIRTTSYEYSVKTNFSSIHLTNDAVQKYLPDYGKYQKGNKLTYEVFQNYLDRQFNGKYNFYQQIYPKMKKIATDAIRASSLIIDPQRKGHNFQVFGMDFMIDKDFKPWLIQINNNPCLQLSCPYLSEIIPTMVQNAIKIIVDSLVPPPAIFQQKRPKFSDNVLQTNKFELVYDSSVQQHSMRKILNEQKINDKVKQLQNQADEEYEDDGKQLDD